MPLQNRVDPFGAIGAVAARGLFMGNRGCCLHDGKRRLTGRFRSSRRWIVCVTDFKGRHRTVMTPNRYTELFFLDEATAFAAGHRPCFECRRADANRFAEAWRRAFGAAERPSADRMDAILHPQRVVSGSGAWPIRTEEIRSLPDGTMLCNGDGSAFLVWQDRLWRWSFDGYEEAPLRVLTETARVHAITPPAIVGAMRAGYRPAVAPISGPISEET